MKEKGTTLKEGWSFLSTGLDVQRAMVDLEKRQQNGDLGEDEMARLEQELSGTLLLVAWKGSKFELSAVLRQVVDTGQFSLFFSSSILAFADEMERILTVLAKESSEITETILMNRAKAILFIGAILKAVVPEAGDEERRQMEKLVADANARRKEKGKKPTKSGASTPPIVSAAPGTAPAPAATEEKKL